MLKRSGGQRQRIWNVLMAALKPLTAEEVVALAGGEIISARTYLNGLKKHGYTSNEAGWVLHKKTGPTAPAYSVQTGEFRDWNVDQPMSAFTLELAFRKHGGSAAAFCEDIGLHRNYTTRLLQMLRGQKVVTGNVEDAVLAWEAARG